MPELPEVETVARALRDAVLNAQIEAVVHASTRVAASCPRGWRKTVVGTRIAAIGRRGKYLIWNLSNGTSLVLHLRMTGKFLLVAPDKPREPYDRLVLQLRRLRERKSRQLVLVDVRQFARIVRIGSDDPLSAEPLSRLGPEATDLDAATLAALLSDSRRPMKSFLLDQNRIAGLGNIYADESLYRARIHPETPAHTLSLRRIRRLSEAIVGIMQEAIAACGTTFDTFADLSGNAGGFAPRLDVYQRTGQPCRRCRSPIRRIELAGRGTHFCPRCQRRPTRKQTKTK